MMFLVLHTFSFFFPSNHLKIKNKLTFLRNCSCIILTWYFHMERDTWEELLGYVSRYVKFVFNFHIKYDLFLWNKLTFLRNCSCIILVYLSTWKDIWEKLREYVSQFVKFIFKFPIKYNLFLWNKLTLKYPKKKSNLT